MTRRADADLRKTESKLVIQVSGSPARSTHLPKQP